MLTDTTQTDIANFRKNISGQNFSLCAIHS